MRQLILRIILTMTSLLTVVCTPSSAEQFVSGQTFFTKPPKLLDVRTTFNAARVPWPTYYYTIDVPSGSGESLEYIKIQKRGGSETLNYFLDRTIAFKGTPDHRGEALAIKSTLWDEETESLTITFDTLVSPGTTFTLGIKPKRNPENGGIYLFGITVFPQGENPLGLYLGNGRLHFYGGDDGSLD